MKKESHRDFTEKENNRSVLTAVLRSVLCSFILLLVIPLGLGATAQMPDILIIDGVKYGIQTNPLEPFLQLHPERRPESDSYCTALWRGYVATWEIRDNLLLLKDMVYPAFSDEEKDTPLMPQVFPGQTEVVADWFRGHLIVPLGDLVEYVHMGYASLFEKYLVIRVERGVVTGRQEMNTDEFNQFRSQQFAAFKKTAMYAEILQGLCDDGMERATLSADDDLERFIFQYYSEHYLAQIFDE